MNLEEVKSVEHLFDRLKLNYILHLFQAKKYFTVEMIRQLTPRDIEDLVPVVDFLPQRMTMRSYVAAMKIPSLKPEIHVLLIDLPSLLKGDFRALKLIDGRSTPLGTADSRVVGKTIANFWLINNYKPSRADYIHGFSKVKETFTAECVNDWIGGELKGRGLLQECLYNLTKLSKKRAQEKGKFGGKKK